MNKMIRNFKDVLNYVRKNQLTITIAASYEGAKIIHIKGRKVVLPITEEELGKIINQQQKEK